MGFNLRQKLEETFADINPFDNGATAQTVRANRAKAAPAQTVKTQTQNRPMFQQNNQPAFTQQKQFKIQTQSPTINVNNSMPKVQTFGQSSDPLKVGQVKTPQIQLPVQQPTALQITAPTAQVPAQQPNAQAPKVYTPEAQQAYTDAKIIGTGSLSEVRQALTRTVDRKNSVKLDPQFKQGKSYEDIARDAGFSIDEVKRYAERNHKGYGDQGLLGNAARATGQFVGGMVKSGTNIVARPFNDLGDMDRSRGEAELQQINRDYRSGNITPAAAMERANTLAGRYTTRKATLGDDGYIRIGNQTPIEFTGNVAQQGIDSASLLPVAGGAASGSAQIASALGNKTAANTLNKAASVMTAGAQTQATSKLANALTARGINPQTANLIGNAVTSNAKQSLVYGTAQTGADVASGRGITPESLAMNYGADFLMGAVPEIGLGSIGRGIDLNNTKVHQELVRTNPIYKANTDKLTAVDATIARAQANGDIRALEGLQAVKAQLSDSNALIARRYAEQGFLGGKNATGFKDAEARGEVFTDTPDGLPRFEVDDSGAKLNDKEFSWGIKMDGKPRKVGQILEHDKLFEQYPELKDVNVRYEPNDLPGHDAHFDPDTNTIVITKSRADKSHLSDIVHELQHSIQEREGFAGGGAPKYRNYKAENASIKRGLQDVNTTLSGKNLAPEQTQRLRAKRDNLIKQLEQTQDQYGNVFTKAKDIADYRKLAGEAEARAVQARMNMPMSERYVPFEAVEAKKTKAVPSNTGKDKALNLQDKEDADYLARILGEDRVNALKNGDYSHWRNPDNTLAYWEEQAKVKITSGKAQSISEKLEGRINPVKVNNNKLYHGTSADNKNTILQEGFKNGSDLPEDAFRAGGYGEMQKSVSFSTDPKIASTFSGSSRRGVVFETSIKKDAKVVTVDGVDYAEDLNDMVQELRKQGIDAVYLEGEKEIAVINPKSLEKITKATEFNPTRAKEDLSELFNQPQSVRSTFYDSLDVPKEDLIVRNEGGKALSIEQIRNHPAIVELDNTIDHHNQQIAELKSAGHPDGFHTIKQHKKSIDVAIKEQNRIANELSRQGVAMSIEPKPKRTAKQVDAELKVMSDSPEFQEFYNGGKITGKSWNEYQRLSKEYRQLADAEAPKPTLQDAPAGKSTKIAPKLTADNSRPKTPSPFERDLQKAGLKPKDQPATTPANQTKSLPEPSKTPVQPKPTPALEAQQHQTSSSQVSGRATKSKSKIRAPKEPQPVQKAVIETNLKESSSYTSKVSEKSKIVKEERRAIKQGAAETYGLRDSFDNSPNVPPELKESLGAFGNSRTVKTNKELWNDAQARMQDPAEAMKFFNENNTDDAVATGYALINNYMKRGNTKEAGDIAMIMAERALESGRQTQAYSMMKKLTPEGSVAYVARRVNKYLNDNPKMAEKVKWNDEVQKKLYGLAEEVNKLPEGRERNLKIGEMQKEINNIFPSSLPDKMITVWKAGLLTSLRTHERNLVGNTINLASEQIASAPASLADRLMSLRTKERTIVASMGEGLGTGAGYGARLAKDQLKTGIDVTNSNLKMDMNHVTWGDSKVEKFFKVYTDGVFRTLGAEDKLFREAAHKNSLVNQAMAQAKNKRLKGNVYDDYVNEKVKNPTAKMLDLADDDAGRATFTHDNVLGDIIKNAKQTVRKSKYGKAPAAVLDFIVPFTQVPSGVASQLYAYSPAKLAKSMYDIGKVMVTQDVGLQRKAAQGFGRSVIGTSVLGAGAYMMAQGLMTGQPEDDAERAQWEAEGKMANSIKVGDRWYQLGSIGPQTLLFLAGAQAVKDKQNGRDPMVTTAGNLGKNFKDQTFLKGMSSALDAIDDPKRYGDSFVESSATSIVPNIVKDVAKATDPNAREAIGTTDKFKASIPGMSQSLPKQRDSYGQEIKNQGIRHMLDLFNSKKEKDLPESSYIDALRSSTGEKDHVPTIADKSIKINGETKKLTSSEYEQYQKYIGQKGKAFISEAMNNAEFKALSPNEQVNKIDKALKDINAAAKAELFGNARKDGKVSADVQEVMTTGKLSIDSSITKAKGVRGTPKEKYESALKDYESKKATLNDVERFKKEKELKTLKVKSNFDGDVVSLWGMSKADIYELLTKDKDGNRKANELIRLDQAMYDAGLTKYLTFKNGIAPAQRGGTKRASTGRKGTGSRGGRSRSAKGKFDYKLFGFSGSGGTSNSKQLHDLLKRAQLKVQK